MQTPAPRFAESTLSGAIGFIFPKKSSAAGVYLVSRSDAIYDGVDLSPYEVTYFKNYYVINAV